MDKNPPANAGAMGSIPGLGGSHMPRVTKRAPPLPSLGTAVKRSPAHHSQRSAAAETQRGQQARTQLVQSQLTAKRPVSAFQAGAGCRPRQGQTAPQGCAGHSLVPVTCCPGSLVSAAAGPGRPMSQMTGPELLGHHGREDKERSDTLPAEDPGQTLAGRSSSAWVGASEIMRWAHLGNPGGGPR